MGPEFDEFVRASADGLLRTSVLLVTDRGLAEDLLQTALLRTARRWASVETDPLHYTRRVLINLAKDTWRNRARRPHEVSDTGLHLVTESLEDTLTARDELLRTVAQLPARQRAVLVLRYFDDLPIAEVAVLVGCSEGTVKSQTHHALARMRALLSEAEEKDHVDR